MLISSPFLSSWSSGKSLGAYLPCPPPQVLKGPKSARFYRVKWNCLKAPLTNCYELERWILLTSHLILDICSPFSHSQHVHLLYSAVFFKDDIQFLYCERALTCSAEKKYILKLRLNLPLRSPFKILPRERAAMSSCNAHWAMSIHGILWNTWLFLNWSIMFLID